MNGEHVGEWHSPADGRHEFRYAPAWFESPHARPISIFFPLRPPSAPYRQGEQDSQDGSIPQKHSHPVHPAILSKTVYRQETMKILDWRAGR
jgi:hypothetical protein